MKYSKSSCGAQMENESNPMWCGVVVHPIPSSSKQTTICSKMSNHISRSVLRGALLENRSGRRAAEAILLCDIPSRGCGWSIN